MSIATLESYRFAVTNFEPEAIVIHCSDERFQLAFRQLIENHLQLAPGHYIPCVVAGGPFPLAHPELEPKAFSSMKRRLLLHRQHAPTLLRLIVINHAECRHYQDLGLGDDKALADLRFLTNAAAPQVAIRDHPISNLFTVLQLTVEAYYASFTDSDGQDRAVTFHPIFS